MIPFVAREHADPPASRPTTHAMLGQIDARLQEAERKRLAVAAPSSVDREEDLLEQHTVS